jgi:hypothetical protein
VEIAARLVARLDGLAVRAAFLDLREHMASGHKAMRVCDASQAPPDRPRLRDRQGPPGLLLRRLPSGERRKRIGRDEGCATAVRHHPANRIRA